VFSAAKAFVARMVRMAIHLTAPDSEGAMGCPEDQEDREVRRKRIGEDLCIDLLVELRVDCWVMICSVV
jgi:hypothetical protein